MRVVVLADTHIPDFARALPPQVIRAVERCDLVLHAGDVTDRELLGDLGQLAPVRVALGNRDNESVAEWGAAAEVEAELDGVRVAMVHDAGPPAGRETRLRRRFPDARLIVFGHSHIPVNYAVDGVRFLNPGSPTWKRRQPRASYAVVTVARGRVACRIAELP